MLDERKDGVKERREAAFAFCAGRVEDLAQLSQTGHLCRATRRALPQVRQIMRQKTES